MSVSEDQGTWVMCRIRRLTYVFDLGLAPKANRDGPSGLLMHLVLNTWVDGSWGLMTGTAVLGDIH